jgi:2-polyprenyl-6-methoxyphenol hydroxylase-like FAD-dependent oxidoreductase
MPQNGDQFQVIVAGGGPIGMLMGIELASRGIKTLICEMREEGVYYTARINLTNARTMEHFRRLGIADKLRANDPVPTKYNRDVTFSTRANGKIIVNIEGACEWKERFPIASEVPEWAPHQAIERTLHERIQELPEAQLVFESTVTDFMQGADGVSVTYETPESAVRVEGQYLVVCDGARSNLRRKLNLPLTGETLAQSMSWHFKAPRLADLFAKTRLSSFTFFLNEDRYSDLIMPQSGDDHWVYMCSPLPEWLDPNDWEAVRKMLFRSIGAEFEITEATGGPWASSSRMAPTYNQGRVLLAGDAAHLTSPFGGFGMNMGAGDTADLGWKIPALLEGWGGPWMLDSYTIERQEAERFIIEGSAHNQKLLGSEILPHMEEESQRGEEVRNQVAELVLKQKTQEFRSLGAQLGYRYLNSPLIIREGNEAPPLDYGEFVPVALPGYRAPHMWLHDESSLFDHFGSGFCLLKLAPSAKTERLESAAARYGVPFKTFELDNQEARNLYERKLILIRPDQHIAWRGDELPEDCEELINIVRGAGNCR